MMKTGQRMIATEPSVIIILITVYTNYEPDFIILSAAIANPLKNKQNYSGIDFASPHNCKNDSHIYREKDEKTI